MAEAITHIGQLTPDPENARRHTPRNVGTIVDALHEVGAARSIVVDEDGVVLAGNATLDAAAQAGIERVLTVDADGETIVAVRRTGLTPEQKRRLALYDNRAAELAEWDTVRLASFLEEDDGSLDGLFEADEIEDILERAEVLVPEAAPPVAPALANECLVEIGCSRAVLAVIRPVLERWKEEHGATVHVS